MQTFSNGNLNLFYHIFANEKYNADVEQTLKEIVKELTIDNFLLETDSPYLAPEPLRGTKNIPSNVKYVAEKMAEIKGIPLKTILKETTDNAIKQFDLPI